MADSGDVHNACRDDLMQAHRKERKDLQARLQTLKHSVPKGDKKRRRDVAAEAARLEAELEEKQQKELEALDLKAEIPLSTTNNVTELDDVTSALENVGICENGVEDSQKLKKVSRAEKRRDKKRQREHNREHQIVKQEVENQFLPRATEARKMKDVLSAEGLAIIEISPDGNCMYKAVEHQLSLRDINKPVATLREEVAGYMCSHADEFLPFLTSKRTGDMMDLVEFQEYCTEVATTSVWGGQVELRALSHICQVPITVVQAAGPSIEIGTEYKSKPLLLSYHRHMYDMGEHYNSLVPAEAKEVDEFIECG